MNCKKFHNQCHASCCSFVPMTREFLRSNFHNQVIPIKEYIEMDHNNVIAITETGKCPFLNTDYSCNVYNTRPEICRKFGDETHIAMTCAHQDKNGNERSLKEWRKIERKQNEMTIKFINKK